MHLSLLILGKIIFICDGWRGRILVPANACIQATEATDGAIVYKIRFNAALQVMYLALSIYILSLRACWCDGCFGLKNY